MQVLDSAWPSPARAWSAVLVLLLAYLLAYVDRAILTILVEPIQRDLGINDSQLALLHGLAFVVFYVTLGLPIGMLADRHSRKRVIVWSIAFWSALTAACGMAQTYAQLFVARMGVGVGEAGLSPASYSMIGDLFPPHRRNAPMGLYMVGIFAGGGLALLVGGAVVKAVGQTPEITLPLVGTLRSWQFVFMVVGLPGLLLALLALTLPEPLRRAADGSVLARSASTHASGGLWRQLRRHPSVYALHFVGFGLLGIPFNVTLLWARPYLSRRFGMEPADAAFLIGTLMVVFCSLGVLCGSALADRWQARGHADASARVGLVAAIGAGLPLALFAAMPSVATAASLLAVVLFFGPSAFGAGPAALQLITPNHQRAVVSAIYLLFANLVGLTIAPALSGALTDYVFRDKAAIGLSTAIVGAAGAALAALCFIVLAPRLRRAVAAEAAR